MEAAALCSAGSIYRTDVSSSTTSWLFIPCLCKVLTAQQSLNAQNLTVRQQNKIEFVDGYGACSHIAADRMRQALHLELQPVMTPYGAWGPSGGCLQGVWSTPIPAKPPELLPQVIHALAEVHLHSYKVGQVSHNRSSNSATDQVCLIMI